MHSGRAGGAPLVSSPPLLSVEPPLAAAPPPLHSSVLMPILTEAAVTTFDSLCALTHSRVTNMSAGRWSVSYIQYARQQVGGLCHTSNTLVGRLLVYVIIGTIVRWSAVYSVYRLLVSIPGFKD